MTNDYCYFDYIGLMYRLFNCSTFIRNIPSIFLALVFFFILLSPNRTWYVSLNINVANKIIRLYFKMHTCWRLTM